MLGGLPPPTSLTSVPLINTARPTFDHFLPSMTTGVTWANSAPIPQSNPHHPSLPPTASAQSGLVLSPAAEPIPQRLVHKIRSGNFVEMKELLADNLALISQLESVPGMHLLGATRPRLREVTTLASWCYCFLGYMAVRTTDLGTRDQLAYARLLIKEVQAKGGLITTGLSGSKPPQIQPSVGTLLMPACRHLPYSEHHLRCMDRVKACFVPFAGE